MENIKALKRKRKLEGRVQCHGTTQNCMDAHIKPSGPMDRMYKYMMTFMGKPKAKSTPEKKKGYQGEADFFNQKAPKKPSFFSRIFKRSQA